MAFAAKGTMTIVNDWGSGFQAEVTITNDGVTPLTNWSAEFNMPISIGSIWNGKVQSNASGRFVVGSAGWNDSVWFYRYARWYCRCKCNGDRKWFGCCEFFQIKFINFFIQTCFIAISFINSKFIAAQFISQIFVCFQSSYFERAYRAH